MRFAMVSIVLFAVMFTRVSAYGCAPAIGEPVTFGAVFPQDFLLLDDGNSAYNATLAMTDLFNNCSYGSRPVEWQLEIATGYDDALLAMKRFSESGIPLVIGSGMDSISDGLNEGAAEYGIVFLDVTERPRLAPSEWSFALRPNHSTLGNHTAQYIQTDLANAVLDEPLRLALVVEDTARAIVMADAVRDELARFIVLDEPMERNSKLAVDIRESDASVLLLISISDDATDLWFDMRQADANVDAWIFLGQEQLAITYRDIDDRDTTGVVIVGSQHFTVANLEQAISPQVYTLFLEEYSTYTDDAPDVHALSAAAGTYYLLFSALGRVPADITTIEIRDALQNTSDIETFNMADTLPLIVRQHQGLDYCLLTPIQYMTCAEPIQPFPTWRQRAVDNQ